jgi:tRNA 2-thiocytidine biosynthesis protein TtcA
MHALVAGEHEAADFREFVRIFKQQTAFEWKRRHATRLWQRGYIDHVLRNEEDTLAVARYIIENPLRAGLVRNPLDYPHIGSLPVCPYDLCMSGRRYVTLLFMGYRSPLEARIAKKTTRAIADFNLIEDGDRIMVGLSGGKDSWALLQILDELRGRAPIDFSLIAVNVDSGYKEFKHELIAKTCRERGWEYRIEHTAIGDVMDDILDANATPCSLCARLRRGVLYRIATEVGATKIALGHHLDDFIETLLLNLLFAGALKAMPARLVSDNGEHVVIRPLVYVEEAEARLYTKQRELPIIGCCCPACGDLSLQRQRVKRLILDLEQEHAGVKQSMLKALGNVMPRHLLDTRLNPSGELRDSAALRLADEAGPALLQIRH